MVGRYRLTAGSHPVIRVGHDSPGWDSQIQKDSRTPLKRRTTVELLTRLFLVQSEKLTLSIMQSEAAGQSKSAAKTSTTLPGINAPLYNETSSSFLTGVFNNWDETALPITVRERVMLGVMAALKDKKNWEEKIFDPVIVRKWKSEALEASDRMIQSESQDLVSPSREGGSSSDAIDVALDIKGIDAPAKQRAVTEDVFNFVSSLVFST